MKSLRRDTDRRAIVARIERMNPGVRALWGRMQAAEMVVHLTESMRMATGALPVAGRRTILRYPPVRQLVMYLLPMPRGLPTAPELVARQPEEWTTELAALLAALDTFAARPAAERWPEHPVFGRMSAGQWGVQQHRHLDHHLRQFGA